MDKKYYIINYCFFPTLFERIICCNIQKKNENSINYAIIQCENESNTNNAIIKMDGQAIKGYTAK